jgi:hypothetical protein
VRAAVEPFWSTMTAVFRCPIASAAGGGYVGRKFRMNMLGFS